MATDTSFPSLPPRARAIMARIGWDLPGPAIERESFRRIEAENGNLRPRFSEAEWRVARRLVHTSADPAIVATLVFRHDAVERGVAALLAGAPIVCDASMIRSGLSLAKLSKANPAYTKGRIICHIGDADVAEEARRSGRTKALCAARKALPEIGGAIVLVGNAPLALARFALHILEGGARPALVVGMPVGFVNVVEAKDLLACCDVPQIVIEGRRGGSPLAVATLHALLETALARVQEAAGEKDGRDGSA